MNSYLRELSWQGILKEAACWNIEHQGTFLNISVSVFEIRMYYPHPHLFELLMIIGLVAFLRHISLLQLSKAQPKQNNESKQ